MKQLKGGLETIIAAVILVGVVVILLFQVINNAGTGGDILNGGASRAASVQSIGMD